jgi:hypothetical protein
VTVRLTRLHGPARLDRDRVLRALAATAAMTTVLLVVPGDVAPSVQVAVGAAVFTVAALALRVVGVAELRQVVARA